MVNRCGWLLPPSRRHSKKPSAGTTHRRETNASRKDGLSRTVSERALMSLWPIPGSSAQDGMRPQRSITAERAGPALRTATTCWLGATL